MNRIKLLDADEEKRVEDSINEWLKKEVPEFRKNAHFKLGITSSRLKVLNYLRLDFKLIFQFVIICKNFMKELFEILRKQR